MNDFLKHKELRHYGIKGMRWGVRKSENVDYPIVDAEYKEIKKPSTKKVEVPAGQLVGASKSVFDGIKSLSDSTSKLFEDKKKNNKFYKKYPNLSDNELAAKLNRLRMEQQYSDLVGDTKIVKTGSEKAKDILQTIGAVAGIGASIAGIGIAISSIKRK